MKKTIIILGVSLMLALTSCTENQRAKTFGGEYTIELEANQILIVATWKGDNLWYLTRTRKAGETPVTSEFIEDSSFGMVEGKVIFKEK